MRKEPNNQKRKLKVNTMSRTSVSVTKALGTSTWLNHVISLIIWLPDVVQVNERVRLVPVVRLDERFRHKSNWQRRTWKINCSPLSPQSVCAIKNVLHVSFV